MPSCQHLSPSVGLRGYAAADPGCHGDRLLYPMDAGDFRKGECQEPTPDESLSFGMEVNKTLSTSLTLDLFFFLSAFGL